MDETQPDQELHHEIFGSILDRTEMTPFLLQPAADYATSLRQATRMMANRGFDTPGGDVLSTSERERAAQYVRRAYEYCFNGLLPFVIRQLDGLASLRSPNEALYRTCLTAISEASGILQDRSFKNIVDDDPRHLLLLASSRKYPFVFSGYQGRDCAIPPAWQQAACCLLKMVHLIKSIEEDSQDINDYAQLGFFLESQGVALNDLYHYDWEHPSPHPRYRAGAAGLCQDLAVLPPPARVPGLRRGERLPGLQQRRRRGRGDRRGEGAAQEPGEHGHEAGQGRGRGGL